MTGSAVPEQNAAEADVLVVDRRAEGGADSESAKPPKPKDVPEPAAADKSTERVRPEEAQSQGVPEAAAEEETPPSRAETEPDRLGVRGPPAGAAGKLLTGSACMSA